jgi:hypothetical protein
MKKIRRSKDERIMILRAKVERAKELLEKILRELKE